MTGRLRRLAGRIGLAPAPRRLDGSRRLDRAQRAWLLQDIREDLAAMVDDAENRGLTERGEVEMLAIRGLIDWLEGGEPPGAEAIGYLERCVEAIPRDRDGEELAQRDAYLAAVGDLGGDEEVAGESWRQDIGEQTRPLLDLQGRRLRGRMGELGLTAGELARRSGIDAVTLVAILSGEEEMRAGQWLDLSEALEVPHEWMFEGVRFVPRTGPGGRGFYEIEPETPGSAGPEDAADGLGADPPDDARRVTGRGRGKVSRRERDTRVPLDGMTEAQLGGVGGRNRLRLQTLDICLIDPASPASVTNLTDNGEASIDEKPIWSPDGKKVAFIFGVGGSTRNLFVMEPEAPDQGSTWRCR